MTVRMMQNEQDSTHMLLNLNKSSQVKGLNVVILAGCSVSSHPVEEIRLPLNLEAEEGNE